MRTKVGHFIYMVRKMNNENKRIKTPTTYEEQLDILEDRGLRITEKEKAIEILGRVNYYRLSAYMLTFKQGNQFQKGITFNQIYSLYEFDKRLRNMIIGMLETIEIAFRSHISYLIAHEYGTLGHMDAKNFINPNYHMDMLRQMDTEINRSNEIFIHHHKTKYEGIFPVWVSIEVISFTLLSKMYSNLKNKDQSKIAKQHYNIPYVYIRNWLYVLTMIRNNCAHYGRLYNKNLTIKFKLDRPAIKKGLKNDSIFTAIYLMGKLTKDNVEWRTFLANLKGLVEQYEQINISLMGFPSDWEDILMEIR